MKRILAPRDLDSKSQEVFRETLAVLRTRDDPEFVQVTDVPLLEQYVRNLQIARHALNRINAREDAYEEWKAKPHPDDEKPPSRGWTSLGAQRQLVQHPDVKTMREALRDANANAVELLLPPRTRKQNEIHGARKDDSDPFS